MHELEDSIDFGSDFDELDKQLTDKSSKNDDSIEVIDTSPGFQRSRRQRQARHEKLRIMTQRNRDKTLKKTQSDTSSNRLKQEVDALLGGIDLQSQFSFTSPIANSMEELKKHPVLNGLSQLLVGESSTFNFNEPKPVSNSKNVPDKENIQPNNSEIARNELENVNLSEFLSSELEINDFESSFKESLVIFDTNPESQGIDEQIIEPSAVSFIKKIDTKDMENAKMALLGKRDPENFSESIFSEDLFSDNLNNSSIIAEGTLLWDVDSVRNTQTQRNLTNLKEKSQKITEKSQNLSLKVDTRQNLRLMSNWGLPKNVLAEYHKKGIKEMFDWQCECLSNTKVLFDGSNLVYSAPTSAGKTLVSEILMTKIVVEKKKKALMILPFVSVVREKMNYLQELLTPAGLRVEGFFGGYHPPGGFDQINIAICTIEKANSIINRLLETNKLNEIGVIVVDEVHLISDAGRGYILELLLAKVMYMCEKFDIKIQIITMSATLPNLKLLQNWLKAELYHTDFRPVELREMIKIGPTLFDAKLQILREIPSNNPIFARDQDNVAQLCLETILEGCSVLIFCPGKDWCEELARNIARIIHEFKKLQTTEAKNLVEQIQEEPIKELKMQLVNSPGGLEQSLNTVLTYACAYHHAGLTAEEREIVENGFKNGVLKIIVATSTLSSGVNLPARRVVIRSPMFGGKVMDSLTYKQMIGRAGRKGKDTLGESILICTEAQKKAGESLISTKLQPLTSCLDVHDHVSAFLYLLM